VKTEWWGAGVVICLERGANLHTAQMMPLPLCVCVLQQHIDLHVWSYCDVVIHSKFRRRPFMGFRALGGQNVQIPLL